MFRICGTAGIHGVFQITTTGKEEIADRGGDKNPATRRQPSGF